MTESAPFTQIQDLSAALAGLVASTAPSVAAGRRLEGSYSFFASVVASQIPAKTATSPMTRLSVIGSSTSQAAGTAAAIGFTVMVLATCVGVARCKASTQSTKARKRMGRDDLTVHGFRSSFRDWAAERTNFPNEMLEMALAHTVGDKVEAAYRRGDMFDKRRKLMDAWAAYCAKPAAPTGEVVPLPARAKERATDDLSA
jgi:hypothetical protein